MCKDPAFLCDKLGPFQVTLGNFRQFAWALFSRFRSFQTIIGNFRQFQEISGNVRCTKPKKEPNLNEVGGYFGPPPKNILTPPSRHPPGDCAPPLLAKPSPSQLPIETNPPKASARTSHSFPPPQNRTKKNPNVDQEKKRKG